MSTGLLLLVFILIVISILLILSFIGPEDRKSGFWYYVQKIRKGMDFVSYWFINIFAIGSILVAVSYGGYTILTRLGILK